MKTVKNLKYTYFIITSTKHRLRNQDVKPRLKLHTKKKKHKID